MKTLKSIDGKSLLIGGLLASTIFFATGATGITDKWSMQQQWEIGTIDVQAYQCLYVLNQEVYDHKTAQESSTRVSVKKMTKHNEWPKGWEPTGETSDGRSVFVRRRIK